MSDNQLWWYLVKFTPGGSATAAKMHKVPDDRENGGGIVYVQAYDIDGAVEEARREYARVKSAKRKKDLRAKGLCSCGRKQDVEGQFTCSSCTERRAEGRERRRRDGEKWVDGRTLPQKNDRAHARIRDRENEMRLTVLCELRIAIKKLETIEQVNAYVAERIVEVRGEHQRNSASSGN